MTAVDLLGLSVPVTYIVFLLIELKWPAHAFPERRGWHWIGVAFLLMVMAISTVLPLLIPEDWLARHRLMDGTRLGVIGGAIIGILVMEAVMYAWHRTVHNVNPLWRGFHQMQHAPKRVDMSGSLVFHPTEVVIQTVLQLVGTVIVLGLDPLAAAITGYFIAFNSFFQHWNVRTPQWLGYVLQRPESHCVHHRTALHYYNYADLPIYDILFGTFRNPGKFMGECGFEEPVDRRWGALFGFADVNAPLYGPASLGAKTRAT